MNDQYQRIRYLWRYKARLKSLLHKCARKMANLSTARAAIYRQTSEYYYWEALGQRTMNRHEDIINELSAIRKEILRGIR